MALLKLTALNAGIKGSIAGTTFQGSVSGQVMKTKPTKGNLDANGKLTLADAGRVLQSKRHLAFLSTRWRMLSNAERRSWATGAINYPFINKWSEVYTGSGFQVYMQLNINRLNTERILFTQCPAPSVVYNAPQFEVFVNFLLQEMRTSVFLASDAYQTQIFATRSMSRGRKPVKSDFKCIYKGDIEATQDVTLQDFYIPIFGNIPSAGNIWFKARTPNFTNGKYGIESFTQSTF